MQFTQNYDQLAVNQIAPVRALAAARISGFASTHRMPRSMTWASGCSARPLSRFTIGSILTLGGRYGLREQAGTPRHLLLTGDRAANFRR
jgi:hypothetical protein